MIQLSVTCDRSVIFSGFSVSSTDKTDRHDITEILLKVALCTLTLTPNNYWMDDTVVYYCIFLYYLSSVDRIICSSWYCYSGCHHRHPNSRYKKKKVSSIL